MTASRAESPLLNLAISASAGTGKTFQLTSRFCGLVIHGSHPGSILAATFTRKAAGEIFSRAISRLLDAVDDAAARKVLGEGIGLPDLGADACRLAVKAIAASLDRMMVLTLDAFFARLAIGFGMELGAPLGWRMLDEAEEKDVQRAAIDRVLRTQDRRELHALLRAARRDGLELSIRKALTKIVEHAHDLSINALPGAFDALEPIGRAMSDVALAECIAAAERLHLGHATARKNYPGLVQAAKDGDWATVVSNTLVCAAAAGNSYYRKPVPADVAVVWRALREHGLRRVTEDFCQQTRAFGRIARAYDEALLEEKQRRGVMSFQDIPRLLLQARPRDAEISVPILDEIAYRIDARLDHILLDEFQDTSVTQFRLLQPMLEEALADGERNRTCLYVGDAKQSIYGWRGGEPRLMQYPLVHWPDRFSVQHLDACRRSVPEVITSVNDVFGNIAAIPALGEKPGIASAAREWSSLFRPHSVAGEQARRRGYVRVTHIALGHAAALRARAAIITADRISELLAARPGMSIGVLAPRKKMIGILLHALSERHIKASQEKGNPLTDSPSVSAACSLLRLASHPGDTACAFHVASGPLAKVAGLKMDAYPAMRADVSARWRSHVAEHGYERTLQAWRNAIAPDCDASDLARFEQLIELAADADAAGGPASPAEFVRNVELLPVESRTGERVRIMTVHGAKGLEFDCVLLPDLSVMLGGRAPAVIASRTDLLGDFDAIASVPSQKLREHWPHVQELHERHEARQSLENLCLLYVAMTRARFSTEIITSAGCGTTLSSVVLGALSIAHPDIQLPDDQTTAGPTVVWEHGDEHWHSQLPPAAASPAKPPPEVTIRVRESPASRRPVVASEHSGPIDLARVLSARRARALTRGNLFHAWMELVSWSHEPRPDEQQLLRAAAAICVGSDEARAEITRFHELLAIPSVHACLSRPEPATDIALHRELSFAVPPDDVLDAPTTIGRFDRVTTWTGPDGRRQAWVVDFKTDRDTRGLAATYGEQLDAYRRAASRLFNLDESSIRTSLLSLATGEVIDVPMEP